MPVSFQGGQPLPPVGSSAYQQAQSGSGSGNYNASTGSLSIAQPTASPAPASSPSPASAPAPVQGGPTTQGAAPGSVYTGQDGNMYMNPASAAPGAANPDQGYGTAQQDLTPMSFDQVAAYFAGQSATAMAGIQETAATAEAEANRQSQIETENSGLALNAAGMAGSSAAAGTAATIETDRANALNAAQAQRDTAVGALQEWAATSTTSEYQNEQKTAASYVTAKQTQATNAIAGLASAGISLQDLQQSNPQEYAQLLQYAGGDSNTLAALYVKSAQGQLMNSGNPIAQSGNTFVYGTQTIDPTTGKPTIKTTEVQIPNLPSGYKVSSFNQAANGTVTYIAFPTDSQGNQTVNPDLPNNGIISGVIGGGSNTPISGLTADQQTTLNNLGLNSTDQELIVGIASGMSPPPSGFGANSAQMMKVKAGLVALGFNTTTASLDYTAMNDYMSTMNSSSQIRLKQAAIAVPPMLQNVQSIFDDFTAQAPQWGITTINSVSLAAAASGAYGPDAQLAAVNLQQQITDITVDLGTISKGGNSATDQALQMGASQLQGTWDSDTFTSALNLIQTNIGYRVQAINAVGVGGVGGTNPYASMVGVNTGTPVPSGPVSASGSSGDTSDPANLGI